MYILDIIYNLHFILLWLLSVFKGWKNKVFWILHFVCVYLSISLDGSLSVPDSLSQSLSPCLISLPALTHKDQVFSQMNFLKMQTGDQKYIASHELFKYLQRLLLVTMATERNKKSSIGST